MRSSAPQARLGLVPRTPPRGCGFAGGSCGSRRRPRPPLSILSLGRGERCAARPHSHAARNSPDQAARLSSTHGEKPCSAQEPAPGMIKPPAMGACQLNLAHAGTPV